MIPSMDRQDEFRRRLVARLLAAANATSVGVAVAATSAAAATSTACGTAIGGDPDQSTTNGDSGSTGGTGGVGGALGTGGAGTGGTGGGGLGTGGLGTGGLGTGGLGTGGGGGSGGDIIIPQDAALPDANMKTRRCVQPNGGMPCATGAEVEVGAYFDEICQQFQEIVVSVSSGPEVEGASCCYELTVRPGDFFECGGYVGRAFLVEGDFVKAVARKGGGWTTGPSPSAKDLDDRTRRALADAWAIDGLFEHASVATFARFAIQLLALGAPSRLLHETLSAGRDEIRHAELCFALASAYAGEPLEPDEFPIGDQIPLQRSLEDMVTETVIEGCIGETLAAMQAAEQLALATDPAVVESLESTVEDETRHAELAWRVTAWAIETGGEKTWAAVARVFDGFRPPPTPKEDLEGVDLEAFAAHGRLTADQARRAALDALDNVVRPCARALLRASAPASRRFDAAQL